MGHRETIALAVVEWPLGYHPCDIGILTCGSESRRGTLLGGQFDWGGRLLKSNGGVQRFPQVGRKSTVECNSTRELDCETYKSSRYESRI